MNVERQFVKQGSIYTPQYRAVEPYRGPRWCPCIPGRPGHPGIRFGAAIAFGTNVGSNTSSTAATTIAVTVTISAGQTVVVACATVNTNITAPTDNAAGGSNVYQQISNRITNTDSIQLWMCVNAKAATTLTMHCTSSRLSCVVATYSGVTAYGNGSSTTGSGTVLSLATTQDAKDAWVVTAFAHVGTGTFSTTTGNLRASVAGAGSTTPGVALMDNTGTAGSSITCACSNTGSTAWASVSAQLGTVDAAAALGTECLVTPTGMSVTF